MNKWDDGECHCPAGAMSDTERDFFGEPPPCPACIDAEPEWLAMMGLTREEAVADFVKYMEDVGLCC
jgi:hypothetical protein